ncbi:MAG: DUF1318 domain-containing protein [Cycloclasticus sp.]|nr:DUF1318 domain-containing protein [Cycloclasticus sp.]
MLHYDGMSPEPQIAAKVGKPLSVVEKLAGEKAIKKTTAGRYVQLPSGRWVKK